MKYTHKVKANLIAILNVAVSWKFLKKIPGKINWLWLWHSREPVDVGVKIFSIGCNAWIERRDSSVYEYTRYVTLTRFYSSFYFISIFLVFSNNFWKALGIARTKWNILLKLVNATSWTFKISISNMLFYRFYQRNCELNFENLSRVVFIHFQDEKLKQI